MTRKFAWIVCGGMATAAVLSLGGCGMELETGYKYRPLNDSPVQRRAYYASPFSPEKTAAEQEQKPGATPHAGADAQ